MIIGILLGAGTACLVWVCGMVVWCIITDRKDERRFNAMLRGMDAGRDKAWRELGMSEEDIALYYTKRAEYMKAPWNRSMNCECDLKTKLVGDGCKVCNPELAAYYEEEEDDDDRRTKHVDRARAGEGAGLHRNDRGVRC